MSDNLAHQLGAATGVSGAGEAASAAENLAKGDTQEAAKDATKAGAKFGSQKLLTTFWGSVWLDWTLLSLLYLNGHLFASLLLPNYVCQFGEDYIFGKVMPKELAKWTEIIILAVLDAIIITIIVAIVYFVYKLVSCSWWDLSSVVLPGGKGIEACFE
ncbi:MAG: hypothetical protein AAB358_01130 [Patescibacteria group bacterium]